MSASEESNFSRIEAPLTNFLNESKPSPSLLHGDLWGGNVFWAHDGPALIDPAVYYGDSEADIAFTEMFGGFGSSFYAAYTEIRPLSQQYQQKKLVYNLYHLLNHANLFGGSYVSSSKGQMSSIIEMFNAG